MFGAAFLYYVFRFIIFAAVAGLGLYVGKVLRQNKSAK